MKAYIEEQMNLSISDYKLAKNAEEKESALRTMHRLQNLAAEKYGFQYADSLLKTE